MSRTHTISLCLIGTGAVAWAVAGRPLVNDSDLSVPLNPLGINGSPYGEVLAMAMQGPISTYGDMGIVGSTHGDHLSETVDDHDHDGGESDLVSEASKLSLEAKFGKFLSKLNGLPQVRTNPYAAGDSLKRHLRRQAEKKLRFAYQLDPSNYANYASLHFFLTEPAVSTRRVLNEESVKLAEDTIEYCLADDSDPRPALTAAAAATNILQLMFIERMDRPHAYSTGEMRKWLVTLDHCIACYDDLSQQWDEAGSWELLSPLRVADCEDRISFVRKIREACEKTIVRLEGDGHQHASNQ